MCERIARNHIALNDIEPEILRRVEVPSDFSLKELPDVIQGAMTWLDYQFFESTAGEKICGLPDQELDYGCNILKAK